jgi:outer membrane protein assembly factor BamA
MRKHWLSYAFTLIVCAGCQHIPNGQYGVTNIGWVGLEKFSDDALEACLVTRQRDATVLRLGLGSNSCGEPPFDSTPPKITLWTLPWTEWPVYDPAIFDIDKERILRWFRARGHYDARVIAVRTYVDGQMVADPVECNPDKSSCELEIMVQIDEGPEIYVQDVRVEAQGALSKEVLASIEKKLTVERWKRFDEHDYEADKGAIQELLQDESYARAKVSGSVSIDPDQKTARVTYIIEPGPACTFGTMTVEGNEDIPAALITQAASIREGKAFSHEALVDAEAAIFALGAFSAAQVVPQGEGSRVDLIAKVRVGRLERWSAGFGIMSGTLQRSLDLESIPQWDVHLSGSYENRDLFGGLRRLRVEDRPRLIFLDDFPKERGGPHVGNLLTLRFEQPQTFEARTTLFFESAWDWGPDPYYGYFRHDITTKLGLSRPFWRNKIQTRAAIGHDIYDITSDIRNAKYEDKVSSYKLPYLEQQLILDFRNNRARPTLGAYVSVAVQEAFRFGDYADWDYIRVTPDFRAYVPLMWDFVLAARFAVGALFISDRADDLDPGSSRLGPTPYRFRGGGANSNRGFQAGGLGAGIDGGIRRYEGSLELRIPLGQDLGLTLFGDVGDVGQVKRIRFEYAHTSVGFGLRYYTILGAIRLDLGWRIPGLQVIGDSNADENQKAKEDLGLAPKAFHLTIGEAF